MGPPARRGGTHAISAKLISWADSGMSWPLLVSPQSQKLGGIHYMWSICNDKKCFVRNGKKAKKNTDASGYTISVPRPRLDKQRRSSKASKFVLYSLYLLPISNTSVNGNWRQMEGLVRKLAKDVSGMVSAWLFRYESDGRTSAACCGWATTCLYDQDVK